MKEAISFRLSEAAERILLNYSKQLQPGWSIGLLKGTDSRYPTRGEQWSIGGYSPDQLKVLIETYKEMGVPLLHEAGSFKVVIPQEHLLKELSGAVLDHGKEGFFVSH